MQDEQNAQIETYLLGRMSASERTRFERQLSTDPVLQNEFAQRNMEHEVMEAMVEMDLLQKLQTWQTETVDAATPQPQSPAKIIPFYQRSSTWAVAATLLLLVGVAFWLLRLDNNYDLATPPVAHTNESERSLVTPQPLPPEETIAVKPAPTTPTNAVDNLPPPAKSSSTTSNATPNYLASLTEYRNPLQMGTLRSGTTDNDLFNTALKQLKNGELDLGIENLTAVVNENPANVDAQYYLGLAQYQQQNYAAAIAPLRVAGQDDFYLENEKAQWYLILAYLQTGQEKLATAALQGLITDGEHSYHSAAVKLVTLMK